MHLSPNCNYRSTFSLLLQDLRKENVMGVFRISLPGKDSREDAKNNENALAPLIGYLQDKKRLPQMMRIDPISPRRLSFEELEELIRNARGRGISAFIYTGSEPLVRKYDFIRICDRYPECVFFCLTGGALIDDKYADEIHRVGNFIPVILHNGMEEMTGSAQGSNSGPGTLAAELLAGRNILFGESCEA